MESETGTWTGISVTEAEILRRDVCQYSMRPKYAKPVLDQSTLLHQGMMAQILATLQKRTRIPKVRIADCLSKSFGYKCSQHDVPKLFHDGLGGSITAGIFDSVVRYIICGPEPVDGEDATALQRIAADICEFFIHPDEREKIPAYFFAPRAFVPSPFDDRELAKAIQWIGRESSLLDTTGLLAFTAFDDKFPQQVSESLMMATKKVVESGIIRVELLFPASHHGASLSAEFVERSLKYGTQNAGVGLRPLEDKNCRLLSPFVSQVYRSFDTTPRNEKLFMVRNDWSADNTQSMTWVASYKETNRFSEWLHSLDAPHKPEADTGDPVNTDADHKLTVDARGAASFKARRMKKSSRHS